MDSQRIGTGVIIGPQLVLTCAHNCFNLSTRTDPKKITFTPAPQFVWPFEKYTVKKAYYHQKFKDCDTSAEDRENDYFYIYDFAVLEIETVDNLEDIYGSVGYDFHWLLHK